MQANLKKDKESTTIDSSYICFQSSGTIAVSFPLLKRSFSPRWQQYS